MGWYFIMSCREPQLIGMMNMKITIKAYLYSSAKTLADVDLQLIDHTFASLLPNLLLAEVAFLTFSKIKGYSQLIMLLTINSCL